MDRRTATDLSSLVFDHGRAVDKWSGIAEAQGRKTMTKQEALEIATAFRDRQGYETTIDAGTDARLYDSMEGVTGAAWVIEAPLPPSTIEGTNTITYVVSVVEKRVEYIINSSGFIKRPDELDMGFSDDELDELREMGFDVLD
ncbi:hypothetical protein [Polyangium sp. 6x1]|uniref:hypothetical protein n=1 Tax=Polyangium sp. 6x1 TaxID=3042689 RepID=UPI0024822F3B|nr:hypothetical protein [Polyangium sp. 6x1]MDI1442568.1 hypothetical protein [Polyangium sp. 6x1]